MSNNSHRMRRREVRIPCWRVSLYFLVVGPLVVWGLSIMLSALASFRIGADDADVLYLLWAMGIYCVAGALAGVAARSCTRAGLMLFAHFAIIVGQVLIEFRFPGAGVGKAIKSGIFFWGLLAIPFGLAWWRLLRAPDHC
jgi:hypothetical protein